MAHGERERDRRRAITLAALLAAIAACWMLLTPPGAGADEPSHLVRAAALARGDLHGTDLGPSSRLEGFELPSRYAVAEPDCYAFHPSIPVTCAQPPPTASSGPTTLLSSAGDYPIWGQLPAGVLSLLPGMAPIWWARIAEASIGFGLVAGALGLVARRRPLVAAAVLVALTPTAWATFVVVNPSAMAIGGAVALWTGLLYADAMSPRGAGWLVGLGWAALALPRRDGLVWACVALLVALVHSRRTGLEWWRGLAIGPRALILVSTLLTAGWGLTTGNRTTRLVALAPIVVVVGELTRWTWRRATSTAGRVTVATTVGVAGVLVVAATLVSRPGGWDSELAERVVGETGNNFIEAVGVLGWLDTPLPVLALALAVGTVGLLAAAALVDRVAPVRDAVAVLLIAVASSWVFELYQGNESGTYWQGRYSLPLLVGIPLLLADVLLAAPAARRVAWTTATTALLVMNIAAWGAARRWAVGTTGSLLPTRWDTYDAPLPPIVLLVALAALSVGLAVALFPALPRAVQNDEPANRRLADAGLSPMA